MMQGVDSKGEREIVLVMGMTGWGKSWWSKLYHQRWLRSLVYDPAMSFPKVQWGDMDDHFSTLKESEESPSQFKLGFIDPEEIGRGGDLTFAVGDMIYFIEECASVFEKGQARLPEWAKNLCFFGRHQSCSIVLIAQRPTYIPIDFRSQANRVITFCQHEDTDMDWLQGFMGKDRMSRMLQLPKFTCFDWHNGQVNEYSIRGHVEKEFGIKLDIGMSNVLPLV